MKRTPSLSRRSFLSTVVGGAAVAGAVGMIAPARASAMQCSDNDRGANADPGGRGRSCAGACNDRDPTDAVGRGRSCGGNRVVPGQELNFRAPGNQVRVSQGSVQQYRNFNGRQQFLYNGRWYNLIGTDGGTLIGTDGGT